MATVWAMNDAMKVKVASAVTALFLGGIAAAGLLSRSSGEGSATTGPTTPQIIHRKKVRTVSTPSAPATIPDASYVAAPAAAPSTVSTPVSPTDDDEVEDVDVEER